ncbi:hypothetical protein ACX1C1_03180 [Paenibacillus sp. strain BS8-2]
MEQLATIEPVAYTAFENDTDQLEKGKEWGLVSEKAIKMKALTYKKEGKTLPCTIIGFADQVTAVIRFDNGQLHSIHPSYLKEMQAASFGKKSAADSDNDGDGAGSAPAVKEPTGTDVSVAESASSSDTAAEQTEASLSDAPPWDVDPADSSLQNVTSPAPSPISGAPKKSKKEKVELPEGKVSLQATVQEFTTVPNHFSDTDDEVIIYEAVSINDPPVELGSAWSSHSATIKKLELAIGDTITFDAKIVAKKLTKHPVPYKINNPAKIQKVT